MSNQLPACTVVLTYFKSLSLDNLRAALYSVRSQLFLANVREVVVVDNDTPDSQPEIMACINELQFPVPVRLLSFKHADSSRTHSWSTNIGVRATDTNWIFYTRADYVLDSGMLARCLSTVATHSAGWDGFVTGDCYQLHQGVLECEALPWRQQGAAVLKQLPGVTAVHTAIDTGVWMTTRAGFEKVGGLDEALTAWGHAQTHFQWKLHRAGTEIVRIPEVLYYHPIHGGPRDLALATQQLQQAAGVDIKELWKRYEGEHIYR